MDARSEFDYHQPGHQLQSMPAMDMVDDKFFLVPGMGALGPGARGSSSAAERKRRFTEEQIRSLESMFHAHQAKLEPREKTELARELGLQPRQVAIWFQNKRARWRSKQLEHDFAALRASYDALHSSVQSLQQEKLTLTTQLHELNERLKERDVGGATATTASSSSCNQDELLDVNKKRNVDFDVGCVDTELRESCVLGGSTTCAATPPAESQCDLGHHQLLDYDVAGFPESFCATPELWEPWPLVEWNAVA